MTTHLTLQPGQFSGPAPHTRGRLDLQVTTAGEEVDGWRPVVGWWHPADEPGQVRASGVWVRAELLDEPG